MNLTLVTLFSVVTPIAPVSEAVVYGDRALVTRRAAVECAPGKSVEVAFPDLPASADLDSLDAEASGARVTAVRWVRPRPTREDPAARQPLERVRAEKAALTRKLERADGAAERTEGYDSLVATWAQQALWRANAAPARWGAAVESVLEETLALERERAALRVRLREVGNREAQLEANLAAAQRQRDNPAVAGRVLVTCTKASATVGLRYLVSGASWEPVYELRADEQAGVVELSTHATVRQVTGEPWTDVRLLLSTARPGDRATPPVLSPLMVWSVEDGRTKQVVASTETIEAAPTASARAPAPSPDRHGLVELAVSGTARIAADGAAVRVLVARTRHQARLRLRAVPKIDPTVFRVAELVNTAPFPLVPGRLEIFRRDAFVGTQPLAEEVPVGGRLTVSFGVEDRLRAGRTILREVERSAGLLGRAQRHLFGYRLHLASHLPAAEEVEVMDHLPVSQLRDVQVAVEPGTTPGYRLEPRDGTVTWRVPLRPGEQKDLDLAFRIDVPAGYR